MPSIIRYGDTYHGISVDGRGVLTNDEHGRRTYAGQHRDGYACGLAVVTYPSGSKDYAEYGPDGQFDGRYFGRSANGTTGYRLYERGGKQKGFATVFADGSCKYNYCQCAPVDPRLLALIAQVAPVEVRRAAPDPHPPLPCHSPPSNRPMRRLGLLPGAREDHGHRGASPRHTPSLMAVRHSPTAAAMHSPTTHSERTGLA